MSRRQRRGGKLGHLRATKKAFWLKLREGLSKEHAAEAVGIDRATAKRWFSKAGGVMPTFVSAPTSHRYLSLSEREEIFTGVERGESIRGIAHRIGRAHSTVQRELRRNMRHHYRSRRWYEGATDGAPRTLPWDYRPSLAQKRAEDEAKRTKAAKLLTDLRLRHYVQSRLNLQWSPEQISDRLKLEFPLDLQMRVSHETIYQSIYIQSRGALRRELARHLRTGRPSRRLHRKSDERRGRIPNMVMISERPPEIEDRAVPGHWEGDLLMGKEGKSAIGTLVERKTRVVHLLHLPNGFGADAVADAIAKGTQRLPEVLWRSLTWDQGREMAKHARLKLATGLEVYFCNPSSPWQRGTNENTNGLLRQYFPKGIDLRQFDQTYLDQVADRLNGRPRKTLGFSTPAEAMEQLLFEASQQPSGATTT